MPFLTKYILLSFTILSVCLPFSVTNQGDASSMFRADYKRSSKSIRRAKIGASPERDILAFLIMKVKVK